MTLNPRMSLVGAAALALACCFPAWGQSDPAKVPPGSGDTVQKDDKKGDRDDLTGPGDGSTGACCFCFGGNLTCIDGTTQDACESRFGGTYLGDSTNCSKGACDSVEPFGACIFTENGATICFETTETDCDSRSGTHFQCQTCDDYIADTYDVTGACCANDGTCTDDVTYTDCFGTDDDGFYLGWQSVCMDPDFCLGACCYVEQMQYVCVQLSQDDCEAIDGANFQGIGEPCDGNACQECPDVDGVACNPGGDTEIHTRDFSFSAGPEGLPAQFTIGGGGAGEPDAFPLFDTDGGNRELNRVVIEIEADVLSRVTMENEDELNGQSFEVAMTLGELLLLPTLPQIPGPPTFLWDVQNPSDDCVYTTQFLGFLEREILTGGIFSAIEEAQAGGDFGPCTGATGDGDLTLDSCPGGALNTANFEGVGTFNLTLQSAIQYAAQETFFDLKNDLNLVEGRVRVIYCFSPTGACCLPEDDPDEPCIRTTESDCTDRGGAYLGDDTDCCPPSQYGACCYEDNGNYLCVVTCEECCEELYGSATWVLGEVCGPDGSCCYDDGDLTDQCIEGISQFCCEEELGGYFVEGGTCQTAVCCLPPDGGVGCDGKTCMIMTEACCERAGGVYIDGADDCGPIGFCCYPGDVCEEGVYQACCEEPDCGGAGVWVSYEDANSIICPIPWDTPSEECIEGECCRVDGSCFVTSSACCFADDPTNTFLPLDDPTCDPYVCCLPNGDCEFISRACCCAQGGTYSNDPMASCDDIGSCCIAEECFDDYVKVCCELDGGIFQGVGTTCDVVVCEPDCHGQCATKGSVLVWSKIDVRWDTANNVVKDTILTFSNDHPNAVELQFYFVNGDDPQWGSCGPRITLTGGQPYRYRASDGDQTGPLAGGIGSLPSWDECFDRVPDPEGGGTMLRGFIYAWAVEACNEIAWDHLSGTATIIEYTTDSAWEYSACGFQALLGNAGEVLPNPGEIRLDGIKYCSTPGSLIMHFFNKNTDAFAANEVLTDVTLHPAGGDFRSFGNPPPITEATFCFNNESRALIERTVCLACWRQDLLDVYLPGVYDQVFGGNVARAEIDGKQGSGCANSIDVALLGVVARYVKFDSNPRADSGANMYWCTNEPEPDVESDSCGPCGFEPSVIFYDCGAGSPEGAGPVAAEEREFPLSPFEQVDGFIDELLRSAGKDVDEDATGSEQAP